MYGNQAVLQALWRMMAIRVDIYYYKYTQKGKSVINNAKGEENGSC